MIICVNNKLFGSNNLFFKHENVYKLNLIFHWTLQEVEKYDQEKSSWAPFKLPDNCRKRSYNSNKRQQIKRAYAKTKRRCKPSSLLKQSIAKAPTNIFAGQHHFKLHRDWAARIAGLIGKFYTKTQSKIDNKKS